MPNRGSSVWQISSPFRVKLILVSADHYGVVIDQRSPEQRIKINMLLIIGAVSFLAALIMDIRRDAGALVLTKVQTDALFMILILSVILMVVGLPLSIMAA